MPGSPVYQQTSIAYCMFLDAFSWVVGWLCLQWVRPLEQLGSHAGGGWKVLCLFFLCRPRLLATAGAWFLWDFSFYGNKVFQSTFIGVLSPTGAGAHCHLVFAASLLFSLCGIIQRVMAKHAATLAWLSVHSAIPMQLSGMYNKTAAAEHAAGISPRAIVQKAMLLRLRLRGEEVLTWSE